MNVLVPIQDVMVGSSNAWLGRVGDDWGLLWSLADRGGGACNAGETVLRGGDLALGMDHDTRQLYSLFTGLHHLQKLLVIWHNIWSLMSIYVHCLLGFS